jgi:hypothetical protein
MGYAIVGTAILAILIIVAARFDWRRMHGSQQPSNKPAVAAIDKMKDWGIWMAGISTGAIAAIIGVLFAKIRCVNNWHRFAATLAVVLFGASVVVSTWLMETLPSLHLRLRENESPENDIYEQKIFWLINVRIGFLAALQHLLFMMAILAFAVFSIAFIAAG